MEKHPIESLMGVSMDKSKARLDRSTVIGNRVQRPDRGSITPRSRVAFGVVAGAGE